MLRRLGDADQSGRPCTAKGIIYPLIAEVIDRDPQALGYNATFWTTPLLRHHFRKQHGIEVCEKSTSRAIAWLGLRWKRPGH